MQQQQIKERWDWNPFELQLLIISLVLELPTDPLVRYIQGEQRSFSQ